MIWLIKAISFYQRFRWNPHARCRFYPTCSEYMKQSIEIHGCLYGIFWGASRLLRCHPLGGRGIDWVAPKVKKKEVRHD